MKAMDADEAKRYVKAIKIIHRYELSVPMRDSDRILRIVNGEYKLNREITPKILEDADKCVTYLHFAQQLNTLRFTGNEKSAQQSDEKPIRNDLKLGDTPAFYEKMGMEKLPLLYTRRHAIKALVPKAGDKQLAYKVPASEVIYFDKEKSRGIERISGIQFPRDYSSLDSGTIIRVPRCIGNRDCAKSADRKGEKFPNRETNALIAAGNTVREACEAISKADRGTFRNTNRDAR